MKASEVYLELAQKVFREKESMRAYGIGGILFDRWWMDLMKDGEFLQNIDWRVITLNLCLMSAIAADEERTQTVSAG